MTKRELDRLIEDHMPLARAQSSRFSREAPDVDRDELESAAMMALVQCAGTYNPDRAAFGTHALHRIRGALKRVIAQERDRSFPCEELYEDTAAAPDARDAVELKIDWQRRLDDGARKLVQERLEGRTLAEMGEAEGIHKSTVMRRLRCAVEDASDV